MTAQAARFAATYAALMAAHDVGDHVLQTDHQAAGKAKDWRAMAGHVGSYHAAQLVVLTALRTLGVRPAWWRVLLAVSWSAGTHALLDRRWPVKRLLQLLGAPGFAELQTPINGPYLADQALHHVCLAVAAAVLASGQR